MHRQEVLHNYTQAHKLISSTKEIITICRADNSYPKWSDSFLLLCYSAADKTIDYLEECSTGNIVDLNELYSIRQFWEALHAFIKPVLDADSLKVPYPLIHFISKHIGELKSVDEAKIVIEIISELNYHHYSLTDLKKSFKWLLGIIGGPELEPGFGFLGLPFTQSKSLFMNCLLYHEIGHFIAEEACVFSSKIRKDVITIIEPSFKDHNEYINWAVNRIIVWMEELFADLVAAKLLGPAYSFAYMELNRLLPSEQIRTFNIDHPCDALRFREQYRALLKDKWNKNENDEPRERWDQLREISTINENEYLPPDVSDIQMLQVWKGLMRFLCEKKIIEQVHDLANESIEGRNNPRDLYRRDAKIVKQCLEHGIVPSVGKNYNDMPHPTSIINGAMFYWLSGMDKLYQVVTSFSENKIKDRDELEQRVEMWCIKAIEDWLIKRKS